MRADPSPGAPSPANPIRPSSRKASTECGPRASPPGDLRGLGRASRTRIPRMSKQRLADGAAFVLAALGSGALALRLGQDANFDQAQYHIYLGWSLLADRLGRDIAPAGLGSYLNPLLHVPVYLGSTHLSPRVFAFLLASVQGLNLFLVYQLARRVLRGAAHAVPLAALAGLVAAAGPCAVSLLGTSFGDNLPSLLFLWSLLLLADAADRAEAPSPWRLLAAGLLGGGAAALKLTFLAFAVALAAGAAALALRRRDPRGLAVFGLGGLAGALIAGGYWGVRLFLLFRNPVFPFANNVFRSPYIAPAAVSDPTWAARGWMDLLTPPLDLALGRTERLMEIAGRDVRYLALFVLLALLPLRLLRPARREATLPASLDVVTITWLTAWATWVGAFHYYRYFAAGEFLAPVVLLAVLRRLRAPRLALVFSLLALAILATTHAGSWGRIKWRPAPLASRTTLIPANADAVVLVDAPMTSFVLPFLPASCRFFGLRASTPQLLDVVAQEVRRHPGPFYRVFRAGAQPSPLGWLGLSDTGTCERLGTNARGPVMICQLTRAKAPPP